MTCRLQQELTLSFKMTLALAGQVFDFNVSLNLLVFTLTPI